jgi:hypothetical protein
MSEQDLRRQAGDIRAALERYDRDQLIDILTHVFRQYVMEGTMPVALSSSPGAASDELLGLPFAQVIERLQLRLDLPELQQFEVAGGRVSVRLDGRLQPIEAPGAPAQLPGSRLQQVEVSLRQAPGVMPAPPAQTGGAPGVMPAPQAAQAAPAPAAQGPAVPAGPAPTGVGPVSRAVAPARQPASEGRPAAAAAPRPAQPAQPAKEERPADDAGGRFTLLEID